MSCDIGDSYNKLASLYNTYITNNKNAIWSREIETQFITDVDSLKKDANDLTTYIEKMKTQNTVQTLAR